ncbi:MAG: hypothetical protein F6K42_01505 [Leptolyngbya sp. SIO1D8]|nr:hypothetical protein [Leptolyngbya sp. SIO1D8]
MFISTNTQKESVDRLILAQYITALLEPQFEQLIYGLNPPQGIIPPPTTAQATRAIVLLNWAENPQARGPGLSQVWFVYNSLLGRIVPQEKGVCPYKGLSFFDFNDTDFNYFFGREKLTQALLEKLKISNFIAIVGASGSGKSSVLRAGLLQRLKSQGDHTIHIFVPGENPIGSLATVFVDKSLSVPDQASQQEKAENHLKKGANGLRLLLQSSLKKTNSKRIILVVDQFEESFTLCQNIFDRQNFFALLLGALKSMPSQLSVILAMRSDFVGKCLESDYSGLAEQVQNNLVTVLPMNREELIEAIIGPAQKVGLAFEPELVRLLLEDVEQSPSSLPLLQYTLEELWKLRQDNLINMSAYGQLNGVTGTLKKRADDFFESLTEEQQSAVEYIFLSLTQIGEGTEPTRKRVSKKDLFISSSYSSEILSQVLYQLATAKLVVTEKISINQSEHLNSDPSQFLIKEDAVVDVAHEALIRHWPRLQEWLKANEERLRKKQSIEVSAKIWLDNEKNQNYLLSDNKLAEARDLIETQTENTPNIVTLNQEAQDFVQRSIPNSIIRQLIKRGIRQATIDDIIHFLTDESITWTGSLQSIHNIVQRIISENPIISGEIDWETLENWLYENEDKIKIKQSIEHATTIWIEHQKNPNFLLSGEKLVQVNPFLEYLTSTSKGAITLNAEAHNFVQKSIRNNKFQRWSRRSLAGIIIAFSVVSTASIVIGQRSNLSRKIAERSEMVFNFQPTNGVQEALRSGRLQQNLNQLTNLRSWIPGIQPLKDNRIQAIATLRNAVYDLRQSNILEGHYSPVNDVTISPDGQIASGDNNGIIKLWKVDGTPVMSIQAHTQPIQSLDFSSDGASLVSTSNDGTIKLWTSEGILQETLRGHSDVVTRAIFSQDDELIASASDDGTLKIWQVTGELQTTIQSDQGTLNDIDFSRDGRRIASGGENGTVKVWNVSDGKLVQTFHGNHCNAISCEVLGVSFSGKQDRIATNGANGSVKLWGLDGRTIENIEKRHRESATALSFNKHFERTAEYKDIDILASASEDQEILLWFWEEGKSFDNQEFLTLLGHETTINSIDFSFQDNELASQDNILVSAGNDGTVRIWSGVRNTLKPIQTGWHGNNQHIRVAFSPELTLKNQGGEEIDQASDQSNEESDDDISLLDKVVTVGGSNTLIVWYKSNDKWVAGNTVNQAHEGGIWDVHYAPNGNHFFTVGEDGKVKKWSFSGEPVKSFSGVGHQSSVDDIDFSLRGTFVTASEDGTIKIWDAEGKLVNEIAIEVEFRTRVAISPNGKLIAAKHEDQTVYLYRQRRNQTWRRVKSLTHPSMIFSIVFDPDGKRLAIGGEDGVIKVWNTDGNLEYDLYGHTNMVRDIAFSPDGNLMASVSDDQNLIFWNKLGAQLYEFPGRHQGKVTDVAFNADGSELVTVSEDGFARFWNLDLNQLMEQGCDVVGNYLKTSPAANPDVQEICGVNRIDPTVMAGQAKDLARQGNQEEGLDKLNVAIKHGYEVNQTPEELIQALAQFNEALRSARDSASDAMQEINRAIANGNPDLDVGKSEAQFQKAFELIETAGLGKAEDFSADEEVSRWIALRMATIRTNENKEDNLEATFNAYKLAKELYPDLEMTAETKALLAKDIILPIADIAWHDSSAKWHDICRAGSTTPGKVNTLVLASCEFALALEPDTIQHDRMRDSLGMAKLYLERNLEAAILNFREFVAWLETDTAQSTYLDEKIEDWRTRRNDCISLLETWQADPTQFETIISAIDAPENCRSFSFDDGHKNNYQSGF